MLAVPSRQPGTSRSHGVLDAQNSIRRTTRMPKCACRVSPLESLRERPPILCAVAPRPVRVF